MDKIQLSLSGDGEQTDSGTAQQARPQAAAPEKESTPVAGYLAAAFGLLGVFGPAILFTPVGFFFSLVALLRGQFVWSFVGLILAVGGVLSSIPLMGLIGATAVFVTFDWQEILKPLYDLFESGKDIMQI